ncbi:MAG: Nif11-like leader peptide family natural product precursor [Eggerthellaceae bacterium]|nr:Nif11-like leader peptide family natural product precursor [Eggerthellaceae bacterium]
MEFKDLTEEQKARLANCKTLEDVLGLAQEYGYELTDDELEGVAGGGDCPNNWADCPTKAWE